MQEELLRQPETKDDPSKEEQTSKPVSIDQDRIAALIKIRQEKLLAVKPFISLKLAGQIEEKLKQEAERLTSDLSKKQKEAVRQNRQQALPKSFWEQKLLKIKSIRID